MVEAATATPGKTNTEASPAASHNLFPVLRMLGSLVIANFSPVVTIDADFRPSSNSVSRKLYTKLVMRGNPRAAVDSGLVSDRRSD
jgi:hypothetical protein